MEEHLERVTSRFEELTHLMSESNVSGEEYATLSKEYADLSPIVAAIRAFREARQQFIDAAQIAEDPESDAEMRALAEEECNELKERLPELEDAVKLLMVPKDEADSRNAILEVRAGTGGDEAALFAADLFRMYQRYADRMGWKFNVIHMQDTGIGVCHTLQMGTAFRAALYEPRFDEKQVTRSDLALVLDGAARDHSMETFRFHAFHPMAEQCPDLERRIIKKPAIPAHVHVPEMVAVPREHHPAIGFKPIAHDGTSARGRALTCRSLAGSSHFPVHSLSRSHSLHRHDA